MPQKKILRKRKTLVKNKPRSKSRKKGDLNRKLWISLVSAFTLCVIIFFVIKKSYIEQDSLGHKYDGKYPVKGLDVSHHNPILNWNVVLGQDISFAYLKATEGTSIEDINYSYNYERAKANNIKVGAYHFYSFGVSGKEQAAHFIEIANCKAGDLLPAIDVEHSPSNPFSKDTTYTKLVIDELKVLENELYKHYGVHPIIYTNRDCYKLYVKNIFPDTPIWICDLTKEPTDIKNWIFWQYSNKGAVGGASENIDLNYFRYSFDLLNKYVLK